MSRRAGTGIIILRIANAFSLLSDLGHMAVIMAMTIGANSMTAVTTSTTTRPCRDLHCGHQQATRQDEGAPPLRPKAVPHAHLVEGLDVRRSVRQH
jgi:hypothetical protein